MKKAHPFIWTSIVVLYISFIFFNSLTPAVQSSKQSGTVLSMVLTMVRSIGLNGAWITEHLIRKSAHFAEYSLLGMLLWKCFQSYKLQGKIWILVQAWMTILIPLTDETLQLFTEGRSGQISDVWLDVSGMIAGSLFIVGCWYLLHRKRDGQKR
jgi:VanZ family protein